MTTSALAPVERFYTCGNPVERIECIRAELRTAANSFINVGVNLKAANDAKEWQALGMRNFTEYCSQFDMSDALAYDLIRIAEMSLAFPDYRERMLDVGISKMRLLLPKFDDGASDDQVDTLLEMASERTWKDLRSELHSSEQDTPPPPVEKYCPGCGVKLELSRDANIVLSED